MPFKHFASQAALVSVALLSACSSEKPAEADRTAPDQTGTVVREKMTAPVQPAETTPSQPAIQTQPGPYGSTVALNRASVTGDVLTIQLTYSGAPKANAQYMKLDDVSVIDDSTAQRLGVLKDNGGKWLASPLSAGGDGVNISLRDTPTIVWFRFPAPSAETTSVSLNLPEAAPFDAIPITR